MAATPAPAIRAIRQGLLLADRSRRVGRLDSTLSRLSTSQRAARQPVVGRHRRQRLCCAQRARRALPKRRIVALHACAWPVLFARIYGVLPLACPNCGIAMRIIAFITDASTVREAVSTLAAQRRFISDCIHPGPAAMGVGRRGSIRVLSPSVPTHWFQNVLGTLNARPSRHLSRIKNMAARAC